MSDQLGSGSVPVLAALEPTAIDSERRHFVYVLRCADGTLYAGYATDVDRRLTEHQTGRGATYTRARRPVAVVARWPHPDRSSALRAEAAFKRLTRADKLARIAEAASSAFDGTPSDRFSRPTAGQSESPSGIPTADPPDNLADRLPVHSPTAAV
jgi:putative endonuclease